MMDFSEYKTIELALKEENKRLQQSRHTYGFGEMVGASERMRALYAQLEKAAHSTSNVLILGETGTGKELCAKTIHELSGRKGAFVPVNCGAIPEQLMESEFFGHVKGAFSGAITNYAGYLASANGGTLFLDEVGELPLRLQGKMLREIESKTYTPVGSSEVRQSDFRLICATNRNLQELVKEKEMRPDFYYRIHVLAIHLPSLRERKGDLGLLVDAYAKSRGVRGNLPASILLAMEQYSWPGNVRELQNALDRFWAFGEMGLEPVTLSENFVCFPVKEPVQAEKTPASVMALSTAREELEKQRIRAVLDQCGWRKGKTADALGVTMRTLQRKLKRYAIVK